jgi:hypothetical protein
MRVSLLVSTLTLAVTVPAEAQLSDCSPFNGSSRRICDAAWTEPGPFILVGEAGYQSGRDQELATDFEDFDLRNATFFAGLGLRLAL